jgi:hypothetical protein
MLLSVYPGTVPAGWPSSLSPAGVGIWERAVPGTADIAGRLISTGSSAAFVDRKRPFQRQKGNVYIKITANMTNVADIRCFLSGFSLPFALPLEKPEVLFSSFIPVINRKLLNPNR